jgi:flagellar biosynthesis/type III secretory pathway chaperone
MNSTALWSDLLGTLRAERTTYHHLFTLLTQEHDALRRMASSPLLELAENKKVVLSDLRDLDTRRVTLFESLLGPHSIHAPLDWLPHLTQALPPWGGQAAAEFREVVKVARRVADQGRQNAELTHRGLGMVREALRLIHGGGNQDSTYEGSGEIRMPSVTSSLSVHG